MISLQSSSSLSYQHLVRVRGSSTGLGKSPVLLLEDKSHPPSTEHTEKRKDSHGAHSESVPRCIDRSEEIRCVDERSVRDRGHHGDSNGFLFLSLGTDGSGPTEDDTVDTVGTETEDDHRDVSTCSIGGW